MANAAGLAEGCRIRCLWHAVCIGLCVDMRIHMCRQHVELGNIKIEHMPGTDLPADMCSKQTVCPTHEKHTARTFGDQSLAPPAAPITRIVHGD